MRLPSISQQQQPASSQPAASQQQPASCSQPAKPASQPAKPAEPASLASLASQASQPANAASGHRSLRPPGLDVSKLFYRGIQSVLIRFRRAAQGGTGRHRLPQAGKPSGTHSTRGAAKHATNPSNIDGIASFSANQVMGRLWDDHFMDLGYPSKFYRVQDAIFIDGSSI